MTGKRAMGRALSRRAIYTDTGAEVAPALDVARLTGAPYERVIALVLRGHITPYAKLGRLVLLEVAEARKALEVYK